MATRRRNSAGQDYTNNADGFTLGGGTTERDLTLSGGNVVISASGSAISIFPATGGTLATLTDLVGFAHAFTGTTTLDFVSPISGETSYTITAITNNNITTNSTVMFKIITSTNHPNAEESILEGITFKESDIVNGVGFNLNGYASQDTWGVYNVVYRIIN